MPDLPQGDSSAASTAANGIEHEHALQLKLMQALAKALDTGSDWRELYDQLAQFSSAHFLSEELLMRLYDYEDYDDHVQDHERMLGWLDDFAAAEMDRAGRKRALNELTALFLRHVGGRDRKLHRYLDAL